MHTEVADQPSGESGINKLTNTDYDVEPFVHNVHNAVTEIQLKINPRIGVFSRIGIIKIRSGPPIVSLQDQSSALCT